MYKTFYRTYFANAICLKIFTNAYQQSCFTFCFAKTSMKFTEILFHKTLYTYSCLCLFLCMCICMCLCVFPHQLLATRPPPPPPPPHPLFADTCSYPSSCPPPLPPPPSGAPLIIHPGRDPKSPLEILEILSAEGADIPHTVMSHIDRTIFTEKDLMEVAKRGCYLEYDLFGVECSHYQVSDCAKQHGSAVCGGTAVVVCMLLCK